MKKYILKLFKSLTYKKISIAFIFLLLCLSSFSQEKKRIFEHNERGNYFLFGNQLNVQKTLDKGVSPILYSGLSFGTVNGFVSEKDSRIWKIESCLVVGQQSSGAANDEGGFLNFNVDIGGKYMHNTDPKQRLPFKLYAGANVFQNLRIRANPQMFNAAFGYDVIGGFGLSAIIGKTIETKGSEINFWKWKYVYEPHKVTFNIEADIPFIFAYLRPTYANIENFVDGRRTPFNTKRTQAASLGKVSYYRFNTGVSYHLTNKNIIRIGYVWEYYKIKSEYNPVQTAMHSIQLLFKFKLNNSNYE